MATNQYGQTEWDADPETAAELRRLANQEKIAAAMAAKGQQSLAGGMVGNTYVGASPLQGLANMFHQYNAGQATRNAEEGYKALGDRKSKEYADAISSYKRNTVGTPEQPMGPPTEEGQMGVNPAFAPTPDARRQAIIEAAVSTNPRLSKMGQLDFQMDARKEDKAAAREDRVFQLEMQHRNNLASIKEKALEGRISREEADKRANESKEQMIRLVAGLRQEPAPTVTEVIKDGKAVKVDARSGRVIGESPAMGKGKAMSPTAQKELIQTDEEIQGGQAALTSLQQAKDINDNAMGFKGAGVVSSLGTLLPEGIRPAAVDATENLDNILTSGALPQLKAIFGGMPTEGERKVLLEVQGSSSKSPAVRKEIFDRAEAAAKKRIEFSQKKAKALREGSYFAGDGGMDTAAPAAAPASGLSAQEKAELEQLRAKFKK
jgi:hypothetical protein